MIQNRFCLRLAAGLAALLLPMGAFAAPALKVLSAAPQGAVQSAGRQAVSVTFNQPVAALSEASQFSSQDCPLVITPAVPGSCRFSGTQTVIFEPSANWPQASRFTVRVKAGFASRVSGEKLAQPYSFMFSTSVPQVQSVRPFNEEHWISLNPTFYLVFNMPVDVDSLPHYARLVSSSGKTAALSFRPISQVEFEKDFSYYTKENIVVASPLKTLEKGELYTLTLDAGVKATVGSLGMARPYTLKFYTYPELSVLGEVNTGCLPYSPMVRFSTPVRMRELVAAASVEPASAVRKLSDRELDQLGSDMVISSVSNENSRKYYKERYNLSDEEINAGTAFFATDLSFLKPEPGENITVTLSKDLRDIYGNRLGQDYTFTVSNSGYCPAVDFSGGFGVLESYLPSRLPIDLMNTPSLPVQAARFNKENFIPFDTVSTRYCKRAPLSDMTFDGAYEFKDVKDKSLKTFFDLKKFNPTAKDSIIFSQVLLKGKNYGEEGCWVSSTDNITDVGVTFKTSPENILLWATSLETGEPMPNLAVELRGKDNKILWTGSTDMNGLALAPGWKKLDVPAADWGQPEIYAFVSSAGGDAVVSNLWNNGLEPWRFNLNYDYNPGAEQTRSMLFSDRGVYRPGETVYLKGVSRQMKDGVWTLPDAVRGKLTVSDSRGETVLSKEVTVSSAFGTFDVSFDIPKTAHTGSWDATFTPQLKGDKDPRSAYYSFRVEAVKQAEFKVTLRPEAENYIAGQEAKFAASAQYNFGAPLADSKASWTLRRESAWFEATDFKEYDFSPYFLRENEYKENGKLLLNAEGKTDAQGALSFSAVMPSAAAPVRVYAELGVQSPARQELFARTSVMVHPADFYLGAKVLTEHAEQNKPVEADVVAVTPQGKRVAASVVANIRKEQWYSVRKTGLSGRLEWVSEKQITELPAQTLEVGEKGAKFAFTPAEAGNYYVTLTSADASGRKVLGGFNVMVYGEGQAYWRQTDDDLLVLKQDKNSYKPGKKARISVESPYENALALVTVEREGILDAWTTAVKGGADYIEVPIKADYLPNVYVGVSLVRGRTGAPVDAKGLDLGKPQGKVGYVNLNVEPASKRIAVTVKPNKEAYQPGQEVTLKLTAKAGGKAVPSEVAVMVVDEGILALTGYQTPDLFSYFYGSRPVSVFTMDNRVYVVGQRNFGEKGENRGGGGGSEAKLGGTDLRNNFSFTPYFNAAVQTDKKGRAEVKFKLPDNLTKFRIMAVVVTADEFGAGEASVKVSKPVMVTSNLPRFARKGDKFSCGAVVYNYEDKKGELTVSAAAKGALKLMGPAEQTVTVPLGGAKEVTWACEAAENGEAEVAFAVNGKKSSDGVLAKLTVSPVEKKQTLALYSSTDGEKEELLDKPGNLNAQADNQITFSLASTALINLKGSMVYLMTYPYDCLEQQMSKALPVITGAKLVEDFNLGDVKDLKKRAQEILDRLPEYQSASGGLGYWKESRPDPYVTAYALEVNYLAKRAGYNVQTKSLEKAAKWLAGAFNKNTRRAYTYSVAETETARAYITYVLALYGENVSASFSTLYAKRASLPLSAQAYLLKAAQVLERSQSQKGALAQGLLNKAVYTPQAVYFDAPEEMPWLHMGSVKTTALALDALLFAKQNFEQAFESASWLIRQLNAQGHWNNTSDNAAVFTALNTYYQAKENAEPDFAAAVKLGAKTAFEQTFKGRSAEAKNGSVPFAQAYGQGTETRVTFAKTGAGTLYYTLGQVYEPLSYETPVNAGFEISRELTALDGKPVQTVRAGERYKVTLTVKNAAARHFVVAEDFVPAGFEIVNSELATESADIAVTDNGSDDYAFERNEKYDDRIAAFADYLPAGTHTYSYVVSALTSGTFAWPCAWASQMYEPAVFGRNATQTLVIK